MNIQFELIIFPKLAARKHSLVAILILFLLTGGCKEEPPFVSYENGTALLDSTYLDNTIPTAEEKAVVIEDVSGVRCVNCPDATLIAKDIMKAFPGRVYTTVLHPKIVSLGVFVDPIVKPGYESKYDFRTDDARIILEQRLGIPNSLPLGAINRRLFPGSDARLIGRQNWYAKTQEELQTTTPVNIALKNSIDESTGNGVLTVTLKYTSLVTGKQYLSLYLTEDSIVDSQIYFDPQTSEAKYYKDYTHMFVLRDVITSPTGDPISNLNTLEPGRTFIKQYAYKLNVNDKINVLAKNARILAFVSKDDALMDIIHAKDIKLKN